MSDNASQLKTASKVIDLVWKDIKLCEEVQDYVYIGDDINSKSILTPGNFLTLNPHIGIPKLENDDNDSDFSPYDSSAERLMQIWKKGQKFLSGFWKMWRDDCLLSLRERTQTVLKSGKITAPSTPKFGDVVLIKGDSPKGLWNMGKIAESITSADGNVRSVKVKIHTGRVIRRTVNLLFPIEVSFSCDSDLTQNQSLPPTIPSDENRRPLRKSAERQGKTK